MFIADDAGNEITQHFDAFLYKILQLAGALLQFTRSKIREKCQANGDGKHGHDGAGYPKRPNIKQRALMKFHGYIP